MKNIEEKWVDVSESPDRHQISSTGLVKRKEYMCSNGRGEYVMPAMLKKQSNMRGYMVVHIGKKLRFVHRLLAIEFIPNPENKPFVNHIDGNKKNNSLSNLEWCTSSENNKHAYDAGLKVGAWKGKSGYDNPSSKEVIQMDLDGNEIARFGSTSVAAKQTGSLQSLVAMCARGDRNKHNGFKWQYATTVKCYE